MADTIFQLPTEIKRMPISGIKIYDGTNSLIFLHPESESSFRITSKTRASDTGSSKTIGYSIESSVYIPYNDYKNTSLLDRLDNYSNAGFTEVACRYYFGNSYPSEVSPAPQIYNSDSGFYLMLSSDMFKINIELEQVEYRPRLIVRTNGFVRNLNRIYNTIQG